MIFDRHMPCKRNTHNGCARREAPIDENRIQTAFGLVWILSYAKCACVLFVVCCQNMAHLNESSRNNSSCRTWIIRGWITKCMCIVRKFVFFFVFNLSINADDTSVHAFIKGIQKNTNTLPLKQWLHLPFWRGLYFIFVFVIFHSDEFRSSLFVVHFFFFFVILLVILWQSSTKYHFKVIKSRKILAQSIDCYINRMDGQMSKQPNVYTHTHTHALSFRFTLWP